LFENNNLKGFVAEGYLQSCGYSTQSLDLFAV